MNELSSEVHRRIQVPPVEQSTTCESQLPLASREDLAETLNAFRPFLLSVARAELSDAMRRKVAPSDVVQETILKGIEVSPGFRGSTREELASWLRAILFKILANYHRAYSAKKRNLKLEVPADSQLACPPHESPSQSVLKDEKWDDFQRAIARLSNDYRESILLRHRDHLSFAEIGARLNKSEEAARKTWKRAVDQLKREMMRHDSKEA